MCGFLWMGPKGGEVSDSTGCTLLGPLGCVTMVGGLSGWQTQGFQPEWPPGIPRGLVTPQWRGWARWPLILWSSLICAHCVMDSVSISHIYTVWISLGSNTKLSSDSIQSTGDTAKTKSYSHDLWVLCHFTKCTTINTVWSVIVFYCVELKSLKHASMKERMNKVPEFLIFPSWLFGWYFTPLGTGRQHMGLLDKHPTLSRSAKQYCYCCCLMPSTSVVVVPQSTHTYVIKLRGSGTIQAIVTPNSDQHKGPHQSRSKLTLALHNCFPGLEMTVFFSLECRLT